MKREAPAGTAADAIELITKDDVCGRLKISPWTLDRKIRRGEFPKPLWLGATTPRWRLSEVEAWQNDPARRQRPAPQAPRRKDRDRR